MGRSVAMSTVLKLLAVVGMATACSSSEVPVGNPPPPPGFPQDRSDLPPDESLIFGSLPNGLRYVVMPNGTPSGAGALHMLVMTGSWNEEPEVAGIAHYLEHMAFNGSENVPEGEMVKRLERVGLAFGADTNASTGFDRTVYKLNMPSITEDVLDEVFFLMRETADKLTFEPEAVERERGIIVSEKRARDTIGYRDFVDNLEFMLSGSNIVERLPIGTDDAIATMMSPDFKEYYNAYYRPERTIMVFVGDHPTTDIIERIESGFGTWVGIGAPGENRPLGTPDLVPGRIDVFADPDVQTSVTLSVLRPYADEPYDSEHLFRRSLEELARMIISERIRREVDMGDAPVLTGGVSAQSLYGLAEATSMTVRAPKGDWEAALAYADQKVREALEFGFSDDEVARAVARTKSRLEQSVASADTRPTTARFGGLIDGLVNSLSQDRVFLHPATRLRLAEAREDEFTAEAIEAAFATLWEGYETPLVRLTYSDTTGPTPDAVRQALASAREVAVSAPASTEVAAFAYTDFGNPGEIVNEVYSEEADAYLVEFANGTLLNFKRTTFSEGRVGVAVRLGAGNLTNPDGTESLRRMAYNLWSSGGLEEHTATDLRAIFAGRPMSVRPRFLPDSDRFAIDGSATAETLRDQLGLTTAYIVAPGLREDPIANYLRSLETWFETYRAVPQQVANQVIPRYIRSGDKRFGHDSFADFEAASVETSAQWIRQELNRGPIEVTIVGDVSLEAAKSAVAETLGAIPPRPLATEDYSEARALTFPQGTEEPVILRHAGEAGKALLRIYWPAPDSENSQIVAQMQVLRAAIRNRLVETVREELGATYSAGAGWSSSRIFPDYGYFVVSLDLEISQVNEVADLVKADLANISANGLSEDAFLRARAPLLERLESQRESNGFWSSILIDAQTDGRALAELPARTVTYTDMRREDVNSLLSKLFTTEDAVTFVLLPDDE